MLDKDYYLNQQIPPEILIGFSSSSKGIKESNGLTANGIEINSTYATTRKGSVRRRDGDWADLSKDLNRNADGSGEWGGRQKTELRARPRPVLGRTILATQHRRTHEASRMRQS